MPEGAESLSRLVIRVRILSVLVEALLVDDRADDQLEQPPGASESVSDRRERTVSRASPEGEREGERASQRRSAKREARNVGGRGVEAVPSRGWRGVAEAMDATEGMRHG